MQVSVQESATGRRAQIIWANVSEWTAGRHPTNVPASMPVEVGIDMVRGLDICLELCRASWVYICARRTNSRTFQSMHRTGREERVYVGVRREVLDGCAEKM